MISFLYLENWIQMYFMCLLRKMAEGMQCYCVPWHPSLLINFLFIIFSMVSHIQLKFDIWIHHTNWYTRSSLKTIFESLKCFLNFGKKSEIFSVCAITFEGMYILSQNCIYRYLTRKYMSWYNISIFFIRSQKKLISLN